MTFGSGGGAPKTCSIITDSAPVVQSFANRDFYTCPLDTLAIITPLLFSFGSGSNGDPDVFNFAGITIKQTDPITGAPVRFNTCFGALSALPFTPSPNYGRKYLAPSSPDTSEFFAQRYDKYVIGSNVAASGTSGPPITTTLQGYGGGIILYPGETVSWGASDSYTNACQWRLRYGLLEYGIST